MKVAADPHYIKGRGYGVVLSLAADECANVGDRLQRADGTSWTLVGAEVGSTVPRGACILRGDVAPSVGDELVRVGA